MGKRKVGQVMTPGSQLSSSHVNHGSSSQVDSHAEGANSQFSTVEFHDSQINSSHVDVSNSQSSSLDGCDSHLHLSHVNDSNSQLSPVPGPSGLSNDDHDSQSSSSPTSGNVSRPKSYMTKSRIKQKSLMKKDMRQQQFNKAKKDYLRGTFKSLHTCAKFYKVPYSTLYGMVQNDGVYSGSGRKSNVLSSDEELLVTKHVKWRASVGCGLTWSGLQKLVQEILIAATTSNTDRVTGYEAQGHMPNTSWVRRFADRNNLTLRATMEISKGRQICSAADMDKWFKDIEELLLDDPNLAPCLEDPSRVFNQDETAVEIGSDSQRVLAEIGTKVLYHVSGGSREHITVSYLCSASGAMVPPRVIYKGVRNMAPIHLKNLPTDGLSGTWNFSVSQKGYINQDLYVEVLKDLDQYLTLHSIQRPVLLIIDGAKAHISLQAAEFCLAKQIQPVLLKPNMTHLLQPLDLTFFCSLKKQLKSSAYEWQCDPANAGQVLNKYSIVGLLHKVTENCLRKPDLLANGFKRSGICPFNPGAPDKSKLLPATIFEPSADSSPGSVEQTTQSSPPQPTPGSSSMDISTQPPPTVYAEVPVCVSDIIPDSNSPISTSQLTIATPSPSPLADIGVPASLQCDISEMSHQDTHEDNISVDNYQFNFDNSTNDEVMDDQPVPVTSTPKHPTRKCSTCLKVIPVSVFSIHTSMCTTPTTSTTPTTTQDITVSPVIPEDKLKSVPEFNLDERIIQLNKFEVLLLTPDQVKEFNQKFSEKKVIQDEPLFNSWLPLKLSTIPTEAESIKRVLANHTASNIPKRKQARQQNLPTGKDRFNPTSQAWIQVLTEQEKKKKSPPGKSKVANQPKKTAKKKLRV